MNRREFKARDKVTVKNTRDGIVEHNAATGEDVSISKREADLNLRSETPEQATISHRGPRRIEDSVGWEVGKRSQSRASPKIQIASKRLQRDEPDSAMKQQSLVQQETVKHQTSKFTEGQTLAEHPNQPSINIDQEVYSSPDAMFPAETTKSMSLSDSRRVSPQPPNAKSQLISEKKQQAPKTDSRLSTDEYSGLKFTKEESALVPKEQKELLKPRVDETAIIAPDEVKPGKLQFTTAETTPDTPKIHHNRKLIKAQKQSERVTGKLEKARNHLPTKRKLRKVRVTDEKNGTVKRKLQFEKTTLSQSEHIKGPIPFRPVKAFGNALMLKAHSKLYQAEHENVSVKAAHRAEIAAEGVVRYTLRFRKTVPYRQVAKLERAARKKSINLAYQQSLAQNPQLKSNFFTRAMQKRKIKKDYVNAAREAQKAAKRATQAGSVVTEAGKALVSVIRRNPTIIGAVVLCILFLFMLMTFIGTFSSMGNGSLGGILTASYLADDVDIDKAELTYGEWETDLQIQIAGIESNQPSYDEYRYSIGEISHNPYELMAYLTVMYHNFTYAAIEADLQTIFAEQYTLTYAPSIETRYQIVTKTNPATGEIYEEQEPYEWRVLTVTLEAQSFTDVAAAHLSGGQLAHYALLLQTKGSRQYVGNPFSFDWLPYVTSYYGYRIHPISGVKDLHRGVDIGIAVGSEILSVQNGIVTFAGYSGDYGNVVVIENDKGIISKYAHCESLFVTPGQTVKVGEVIAAVGNTGSSTGAHLHFEVLKESLYLNPLYFADTGSYNLAPVYGYAGTPMGDGTYAALLTKAEKYLGYPYVYGGSSPATSFDCSGYISYILRTAGVKDVGRETAQGLYNLCMPISPSDARPGDLVFFHSTYSLPTPITHVGLYVGVINGHPTMLHCGSPIQYTRIDTTYWQSHLYGYGRI